MFRRCLGSLAVAYFTFLVLPSFAEDAIQLHLDATNAPRKRIAAHLVIPAKPGPLTLYYPKWLPGEHSPSGQVVDLTGVRFRAGDQELPWTRDNVDMFAFHVTVPDGASGLEADVEFLTSPVTEGLDSAASTTSRLAVLYWNQVLLYPSGSVIQRTEVQPSLTLPKDWQMACALPIVGTDANGTIHFKTVTLERLCDSPVLSGQHFKEIALGARDGPKHLLCLAADSEAALTLSPELKANYDRLVAEAKALFGARHYDSYRFLLTLSDHVPLTGLEHHESSDNRVLERTHIDAEKHNWYADLLPHEFVHSWNGKYRRPAAMVVNDFQRPIHTKLLWVYEGLTQYLGMVLAARSGLWTPETSRDNFARIAEWSKNQRGRVWRSLEDTAVAAQHLYNSRPDGSSRRRSVDFYDEGVLIWLDADTLIREKTGDKKSLDDFCIAFFGGGDGAPEVKPYEFEDVVRTLNGVVAHDWQHFFDERVMRAGAEPPLDGIKRSGWKPAYSPKRSKSQETWEADRKNIDLTASLGLLLKDDGTVVDVIPSKPADKSGVAPGMKLVAVNGRRWTPEILRTAIAGTKNGPGKLDLLVENSDYFETLEVRYADGEKYPKLERIATERDRLGDILRAKTPAVGPK